MRVLPFWFSIIVLVGAGCLRAAPAYARPATYVLKQHIISDNRTDVTICNAKTGHTVWTRKFTRIYDGDNGGQQISWSADHRAVAIVDSADDGYHITIWNAGGKTQTISRIPLSARIHRMYRTFFKKDLLGADAFSGVTLSPDKKRLLIHISTAQGPATIDEGELWCVTLPSLRVQQLTGCSVGTPYWSAPRTAHFVDIVGLVDGPKGYSPVEVKAKKSVRVR